MLFRECPSYPLPIVSNKVLFSKPRTRCIGTSFELQGDRPTARAARAARGDRPTVKRSVCRLNAGAPGPHSRTEASGPGSDRNGRCSTAKRCRVSSVSTGVASSGLERHRCSSLGVGHRLEGLQATVRQTTPRLRDSSVLPGERSGGPGFTGRNSVPVGQEGYTSGASRAEQHRVLLPLLPREEKGGGACGPFWTYGL